MNCEPCLPVNVIAHEREVECYSEELTSDQEQHIVEDVNDVLREHKLGEGVERKKQNHKSYLIISD